MLVSADFRARILRCVDKGLESIGETAKKVLYWHLANTFGLRIEEIPERPDKLSEALRKMYGPAAVILESNIIREIVREFGLEGMPSSLSEAIASARNAAAKA